MLVPLLTVVLRVLLDGSQSPPHRLSPQEAAPRIFHAMFSQVGSRAPHSRTPRHPISDPEMSMGKTLKSH